MLLLPVPVDDSVLLDLPVFHMWTQRRDFIVTAVSRA